MKRSLLTMLLIAALAGCQSEAPSRAVNGTTAGASKPGMPPPSQPAGPSGILTASVGTGSAEITTLTLHDINTGRPLSTATMPGRYLRSKLRRQSFSPDWSMLVWADNCQMLLARRTPDGNYQEAARWRPPGYKPADSSTSPCLTSPLFKQGRVWAALVAGNGVGEAKVVSFDPSAPQSALREEGSGGWRLDREGRATTQISVKVTNTGEYGSTLIASDRVLVWAEIRGSSTSYTCDEAVNDQTLLCVANGGHSQAYGALALLTADPGAKTVTLRQAVPNIDENVQGAYLAPDGKSAAIRTGTGWYLAQLGGAAKPRRLFAQLGTQHGEVQFWA